MWVMLHGLMDAYVDGAFCGCCAGLGETWNLSCAQGEGLGHLQGQARDSVGWWSGHRSVGAESCWVLQGPGLLTGLHVWPGSLWQGRLGAYHAHRGRVGAVAGAGFGLWGLWEGAQVSWGRVLWGLAGDGACHRIAGLAWVGVSGTSWPCGTG